MNYNKYLYLFIFFFLLNCSTDLLKNKNFNSKTDSSFTNKGFALLYTEDLFNKKIISKKIDNRGLVILQKNLKKNTNVKITNILNNKSIIAKVGSRAEYPLFNNSVISLRIFEELELDIDEPYVEIISILNNEMFIAKKAKTFDVEKKVANKAPISSISINDLKKTTKKISLSKDKFIYSIKIADFYFESTANLMFMRIKEVTPIKKTHVKKISETKYRVLLGPFYNLISLQNTFNDIEILNFENIEIIKND